MAETPNSPCLWHGKEDKNIVVTTTHIDSCSTSEVRVSDASGVTPASPKASSKAVQGPVLAALFHVRVAEIEQLLCQR